MDLRRVDLESRCYLVKLRGDSSKRMRRRSKSCILGWNRGGCEFPSRSCSKDRGCRHSTGCTAAISQDAPSNAPRKHLRTTRSWMPQVLNRSSSIAVSMRSNKSTEQRRQNLMFTEIVIVLRLATLPSLARLSILFLTRILVRTSPIDR